MTKRTTKNKRWMLGGMASIALLIAGVLLYVNQPEEVITDEETKEIIWSDERLYEESVVSYSLVDEGILDFEDELKDWVDENNVNKGVYSHNTDEYTYIMVTVGEEEVEQAVQLYDVRTDKDTLYVGYSFIEMEHTIEREYDAISYMLIRLEKSEKTVEGRLIAAL